MAGAREEGLPNFDIMELRAFMKVLVFVSFMETLESMDSLAYILEY